MTISFNTGATASANNATSVAITIPSGVNTNDVMIMSLAVFTEDSSTPTVSFSGAGGSWSQIGSTQLATDNTIYSYGFAFQRVATSGDPGQSLTISETGSPSGSTWLTVTIAAYTGANTGSPIDVNGGASKVNGGSNGSITLPSETTNVPGDWGIFLYAGGVASGATITGPASSTQRENIISSAGIGSGIWDSNGSVGNSGTVIGGGTFSSTGSGTGYWTGFTIGLAPAGASVSLTAPNLALAAPLPSVEADSNVSLTVPNLALAAPILTLQFPVNSVDLTTPNLVLRAPLISPPGGVTVVAGLTDERRKFAKLRMLGII